MTPRNGTSWIRTFDVRAAPRVNLVCFPYAAGAASSFRRLSAAVPRHIQVYSVQYPGRQDRLFEDPYDSVHDLAAHVCKEVEGLPARPTVLLGHSLGASVAFEVATLLAQSSTGLLGLVASARPAPSHRPTTRHHLASDHELLAGLRLLNAPNVSALDDDGLAQLMLPTIRSDYRASERYHHADATPVSCPVVALVGSTDPVVSPDQAHGWGRYTTGGLVVHEYPGDHFFIDTSLPQVVDDLSAFVDRSLSGGTVPVRRRSAHHR